MIDIGANLTSGQFRQDLDAVLERAWAAGLEGIVVTGTSEEDSVAALALAEREPARLYCTAGVHPHHADAFTPETVSVLRALCNREPVRSVGETGLDFNRNYSQPEAQERAFRAQLELAAETGLPVFLHQRDAFDAQHAILREFRDALAGGGVAHCFTGTREELFAWLDLDLHVGMTGWLCDERRGQHLRALVGSIPEDRLLVETDAPYLLPRTLEPRPASRRNEPMYLPEVIRVLAACRDQPAEVVAAQTTTNARRLFLRG